MKKVNGQFTGKVKVSCDSKYIHGTGVNEDVAETKKKIYVFKNELAKAIDMCYKRHVNSFKQYETAIDILQETLREKFVEYGEKL